MKKIILTFLLTIFLSNSAFAAIEDTSYAKYFPLQIGNWWDFKFVMNGIPVYHRRTITGDTIINSKLYYKYYHGYPQGYTRLYRYDPGDTSIHIIFGGLDKVWFKFNANVGDSGQISGNIYWKLYQKYVTIGSIWGDIDSCIRFRIYSIAGVDGYETFGLAPGIGNIEQFIGSFTFANIDSAMVGSVHYPLLTNVINASSEIPAAFSLNQNYPNPFNPITKIKFSLPHPSKGGGLDVKLIVFDVLGKEVANLIPPLWGGKEGFSPGTYEVEWDASSFPSGVYFYKLIASDASAPLSITYSETRKMVLIK